ncbi:hypothetical protein KA405_01690 [Patescibacteria group bacterium]|nr:hypothetical protein [Patescibacteria group bacterium]
MVQRPNRAMVSNAPRINPNDKSAHPRVICVNPTPLTRNAINAAAA